jgi:MFS transporter, ACS family, tartrate transporter
MSVGTGRTVAYDSIETKTIRKLRIRILPFVFVLYVAAYLDRINIGFAALTMNKELAITSAQYGLLSGIFFLAYALFEIPSNLMLHRIGARIWMARILITWGTVAALTGFVSTVQQLYSMRFLLGLAEAGYFPGILLYLTYWFPQREQARAIALLLTGFPVTIILGAPVSGLILDHVHWLGLSSWRWLLVLEGLPAIVLGLLTYLVMPSRPGDAKFLSAHEKYAIQAELGREEQQKLKERHYSVLQAMASPRVWHLVLIYLGMTAGTYTLTLWGPQLVKSFSSVYSNSFVGLLVMIPSLAGLIAMIFVARSSDRMMERRYHVAIPAFLGAAALFLLSSVHASFYSLALLSVLALGVCSYYGPFWAIPSEFLTGFSAAAGIALINSVGNLGAFVGPYAIGAVAERTGNMRLGLAMVGVWLFLSATLVLLLPRKA